MAIRKSLPIALTIAGSDSGGGAGIQADLKTFAALGVHGTSVITCLTAQNPRRVLRVEPCSPRMLEQQLTAVFSELPPAAIKTGMLFSAANIRRVATFLGATGGRSPLVVDPVMVSTSGTRLLAADALAALQDRLLPLATLITPNLDEAAMLAECKITSLETMAAAARIIQSRYGSAVLVKGITTHGTGCTYSAAICGGLAQGKSLKLAVRLGKDYISQAIARSRRIGCYFTLGLPA